MKKLKSYGLLAASAGILTLAACGDDSTTNNYDNTAIESYSEKSLPDCTKENEGALAFVKNDETLRVCYDTEWFVINGKDGIKGSKGEQGKQGDEGTKGEAGDNGTGCTVSMLADSTGLKLSCDGDSIGVIPKGPQGDKGETGADGDKGDDGSNCIPCKTENLSDNSGYKIICGGDSVAVIHNGKSTDATTPAGNSSSSGSPTVSPIVEDKSSDSKPGDTPVVDDKSSDSKPGDTPVVDDKSSDSKPGDTPVVDDKSSDSKPGDTPVVDDKSSSSEDILVEPATSAYNKSTLPSNFNELLSFFEVSGYDQNLNAPDFYTYNPFYEHVWYLNYSSSDDPDAKGGIIETINSAAKGSGLFAGSPFESKVEGCIDTSSDFLYRIEITHSNEDGQHIFSIILTFREVIS